MPSPVTYNDKSMNGRRLISLGAPQNDSDGATKLYADTVYANARSRANHQGMQTASTISDFDTAVRLNRLDQLAAPTGAVSFNSQRATNQADPTSPQDSATKNYVDTQIAGLATGQTLKGTVRVVAKTNINISSPGATIDGVAMAANDIFFPVNNTDGKENGPWVWNGASVAATRPANWDSSAEAVLGSYWIVREGTSADSFVLMSNDTAVTLGTTVLSFVIISVGGASIGRSSQTCPAIAAGATWTHTHNLNSTDVLYAVKRVASPYDYIEVYTTTPDNNNIAHTPDIAMASGEFRSVVKN